MSSRLHEEAWIPYFECYFFMFKQIFAVMLTRQQPCLAIKVGKSACDNIAFCLLNRNGYTAY